MKEVMAVIRLNKVNQTKKFLAEAGFPAFTCRKVLGRGKKSIDITLLESAIEEGDLPTKAYYESVSEKGRLIPKRLFTLIVNDEDVKPVIDIIMGINSTGTPGDGKIFVLPIEEVYRVRDEECGNSVV